MIKHDYKQRINQEFRNKVEKLVIPNWLSHPFVMFGGAFSVIILALWFSSSTPNTSNLTIEQIDAAVAETIQQEKHYGDPIAIPLEFKSAQLSNPVIRVNFDLKHWKIESVKKGDSLFKIFKRIGLTSQQLHQIINLDNNTKKLKNLLPGEAIWYQTNGSQLKALKYAINLQQTLYVELINQQLTSRIDNKTIEYRTAYAQATINDSLFAAGKQAGLTDSQVMALANIFGWDIDFILDIRQGDSFSMLYQEKYIEGDKIGNGEIIAAEFINQGKSYKAVRYTNSKNNKSSYYTPDGHSMRKAFLRAPLNFSYISSNFKRNRFHPILKRWKAHRGIDYRAPTGTPIRAAGDGKVIMSSYNKFNGKYVFIQHGQGIVTKYLHMSRRAVSKNKRVKQGQLIGYVGATGLAQAPHLHFEFVVNGVHRNPRTVKLPQAKPITKKEKALFTQQTEQWLVQLDSRNSLQHEQQILAP